MSDIGFGYYDGDDTEIMNNQQQVVPPQPSEEERTPKWFRNYMEKSAKEIKELRQKLADKEVAEKFQAKGYDPAAALLYQGDPEKVDEWLTSNGALLAKRPGAPEEEIAPPAQQGPPASTVSAEDQAKLQQMNMAGGSVASPLGSEAELAAALNAAKTPQEFEQVARANGWDYSVDGLFG